MSESGSSILITGGTGFIGSRLALHCATQGHRVRTFALAPRTPAERSNVRELKDLGVECIEGSVTESDAVAAACAGVKLVYHLAAAQHETNVPDSYYREVNVDGTRNVFAAAERAGVQRVVHASTIGVFGSQGRRPVDDRAPLSPENRYGKTKLEGESVATAFGSRVPVVIVRISETYGPGDWRLLKLFRALKRGRFVHIGPESNLHHPVYIDDLVLALDRAAVTEVPSGGFVVAGPRPLTTRDMIEAICRALGAPVPRWRVPLRPLELTAAAMEALLPPLRIQPPLHRRRLDFFIKSFQFDGVAARSALGYLPIIEFTEGARRTAEWYQGMNLL